MLQILRCSWRWEVASPYQHDAYERPLRGRPSIFDVNDERLLTKGALGAFEAEWLNEVRTWLEGTKKGGMALGVHHTKSVLERLNLEHTPPHILHIAGSNGKGTVCALVAGALSLSNVPNLLFSSPHLIRVEERIRVNGVPIDAEKFDAALQSVHQAAGQPPAVPLTFFEATYLAAMQCANMEHVEVLILETGLGGRKDATRSGPATVCLVTSLSAEHSDILGDTIPKIAKEKAAIARPDRPILIRNPLDEDVKQAIVEQVQAPGQPQLGEQQRPAEVDFIEIPNKSSVREEACLLARALLEKSGLPTSALDTAFETVQWPARMQHINATTKDGHSFILDAAHNPSGLARVLPELEHHVSNACKEGNAGWSLLFGTSPQIDLEAFCQPLIDLCCRHPPRHIVLTVPQGGRYPGVSTDRLAKLGWPCDSIHVHENPENAVAHLDGLDPVDVGLVVSLGSLYLQGNILESLGRSSNEDLSLMAKQS